METIANRIGMLVDEACGGNRSELARKINVTPAYAAQLYSGSRIPSDRTIFDICREFGVREEWLRTGAGEMYQPVSEDEQLAAIFGDVLAGRDSDKNRFFKAVAQLPDDVVSSLINAIILMAEALHNTDDP